MPVSNLMLNLMERNTKLLSKIHKNQTFRARREIKHEFKKFSDKELVKYIKHKNYLGHDVICTAIIYENAEILEDLFDIIDERGIENHFKDNNLKSDIKMAMYELYDPPSERLSLAVESFLKL